MNKEVVSNLKIIAICIVIMFAIGYFSSYVFKHLMKEAIKKSFIQEEIGQGEDDNPYAPDE